MLIKNSSFPLRDKYRWKIKNQEESVGMHGGMLVCTSPQQSSQHWYTHPGVRLPISHADRADTGGKTCKCRLESIRGPMGNSEQGLFRNASAISLLFSLHRVKITRKRNPVFCTAASSSFSLTHLHPISGWLFCIVQDQHYAEKW